MNNLQLPLAENKADWVSTFTDDKQTSVQPLAVSKQQVPDLTGMGAKDAVFLLERMGLNVQVQGRGRVISQNIQPGTKATKGSPIMIYLQ